MEKPETSGERLRMAARLAGFAIPEADIESASAAFQRVLPSLEQMMALDLAEVEPIIAPRYAKVPPP